jgi:hypothetical protein
MGVVGDDTIAFGAVARKTSRSEGIAVSATELRLPQSDRAIIIASEESGLE